MLPTSTPHPDYFYGFAKACFTPLLLRTVHRNNWCPVQQRRKDWHIKGKVTTDKVPLYWQNKETEQAEISFWFLTILVSCGVTGSSKESVFSDRSVFLVKIPPSLRSKTSDWIGIWQPSFLTVMLSPLLREPRVEGRVSWKLCSIYYLLSTSNAHRAVWGREVKAKPAQRAYSPRAYLATRSRGVEPC